MKYMQFEKGKLVKITKLKRNSLLMQTDNPSAVHSYQGIMVIGPENKSLTRDECTKIEGLIRKLKPSEV